MAGTLLQGFSTANRVVIPPALTPTVLARHSAERFPPPERLSALLSSSAKCRMGTENKLPSRPWGEAEAHKPCAVGARSASALAGRDPGI